MLKENWRFIARIERLFDNVFIVVSFILAYYGRSSLMFWNQILGSSFRFEPTELAPLQDYYIVLLTAVLAYNIALNWFGAYGSMRLRSNLQVFGISVMSSVVVFISLAAVLFTLKIQVSRSFIGLFCVSVSLLLTLERFVVLRLLRYWRRQGRNFRNVIICGVGEQAVRLSHQITARPELGVGIRAFSDLRPASRDTTVLDFLKKIAPIQGVKTNRVIFGTDAVQQALTDYTIDEVIFTDVLEVMPQVQELLLICTEQGVRTTLAADLFSIGMVKSGISYFGDMPLIHFETPPGDGWSLYFKRVLDIVISGMLLVFLSWAFLLIGLIVKLTSSGPVLFKQKRIGLNGRIFSIYKFRSMYEDAEEKLAELAQYNEMRGPAFKMKNDPRVTPFGRFLRRYSLDELPQLWNVFRGDMSLVGPRPPVPGEVSLYERRDRRRLSMRPGLTCTWQVSGRNEIIDFESWVKMDLEYIDNWSLLRDLLLLVRTIPAVIFGTGAR